MGEGTHEAGGGGAQLHAVNERTVSPARELRWPLNTISVLDHRFGSRRHDHG